MQHSFETEGGYSGSPIIVKFHEELFGQYIVAIHRGVDSDGNKKSIKMTENVVERLIEFEQKLRKDEVSRVKFSTVEFEKCFQNAKNAQAEQ